MVSAAHDQLWGRSLGEFVLRERIGEGGFGAVYRASQRALDREAVIKVLHSRLYASKAATERFLREAKLASKLDHPYAAHIYAFGAEPDGVLWIAMELVRGTPLDQFLRIQGPLPLERLVPLLERLCEVVHTAHEQGIVHRDIKPANVMVLARAGRLLPKLLDFGIAKGPGDSSVERIASSDTLPKLDDDAAIAETYDSTPPDPAETQDSVQLTRRGSIMGSPPYMAPEQWVDAGRVDARTDLYALGVLAYECLTGKPPFIGATITLIAQAHAKQQPAPVSPQHPAELDRVFAKVLAKRADDRYRDALSFSSAFREASGIALDLVRLPVLERTRHAAAVNEAPQPIAQAIALLEAARNVHQARDAVNQVARTMSRYVGLLALLSRSRVSVEIEGSGVAESLRELYKRSLDDSEWVELARTLTGSWTGARDAHPIPELVEAFHERDLAADLAALIALRERRANSQNAMLELLGEATERISTLLDKLAFLREYPLVVPASGGFAERWMGARLGQRSTMPVRGKGLPVGDPALLDAEGTPVLSLAPMFQVAAPTPGAALELFLFDGRDTRGAKLVALPGEFERHDDELWVWLRTQLVGTLDEQAESFREETPPYLGLSSFSAADAASFFGREKQVDAFCNRLKLLPLLTVVGRSGAGKSSFVYAGVVPALGWRLVGVRPGPSPVAALVAGLEHAKIGDPSIRQAIELDREALGELLRADAAERGPIVLVVDQLEEMFTLCEDDEERRIYAESIASAARASEDPVRVIFTLRDDFLVRTEQVPSLRHRIAQGLQLLTVPGADDLQRILVEPARRAGYELEADLAVEMVKDVTDQPGALALLSFTAAKLWDRRDRHFRQLTRAAYKTLGGVGGALARHADATLDELPSDERALAREAFRHLVSSQNTRRVVPQRDLRQLLGGSETAARTIERLIASRLLVAAENEAGAETIEIVHETLLLAWPRLVEWRREDAEGARFREQLRAAAEQWHERGRPKGLLWRGDAFADYERWRARHTGPLTDVEAAFADASRAEALRGRRNRRALLAGVFGVLLAVVIGLVMFNGRLAEQRAALHDNLRQQFEDEGRRLVLDGDPQRGLAYLGAASESGARGPAHDLMTAFASRILATKQLSLVHRDSVTRAAFVPDETAAITCGYETEAKLWDLSTRRTLRTFPHDKSVTRCTLSSDGRLLATASFDGTVGVWEVASGRRVVLLHTDEAKFQAVLFSPDASTLVTVGGDDVVQLWDASSGAARVTLQAERHPVQESTITRPADISAVTGVLAVGDGQGVTRLWSLATSKELARNADHRGRISTVRFSKDGQRLVAASEDGSASVIDSGSGKRLVEVQHRAAVTSADITADGEIIATGSADRTVALWNAHTGALVHLLPATQAGVNAVAFRPDGRQLAAVSDDTTAMLWDVATGAVHARLVGHGGAINDLRFSASGRRLITAGQDLTAIVWDTRPQQPIWETHAHDAAVTSIDFSPDSSRVLTASDDGAIRIWSRDSDKPLLELHQSGAVKRARYSPDGSAIASVGADRLVHVWDARTGSERRVLAGHEQMIADVAWHPDGVHIGTAGQDGSARVWSLDGKPPVVFRGHQQSPVGSIAFSPRGDRIVTAGEDNATRMWDPITGIELAKWEDPNQMGGVSFDASGTRLLGSPLVAQARIWSVANGETLAEIAGHAGNITAQCWNADGAFAATAGFDGTVRLWDTSRGDMLAILRSAVNAERDSVAMSRDGRFIASGAEDGTFTVWELPVPAADLPTTMRCEVPYTLREGRLFRVPRDCAR